MTSARSQNPERKKKSPGWLSGVGTLLGVVIGLYTIDSWLRQERSHEVGISVDLLTASPQRMGEDIIFLIKNASDGLLEKPAVGISVEQLGKKYQSLSVKITSLLPKSEKELVLHTPLPALPVGSTIEISMIAQGPFPFTNTIWKKSYRVVYFVPKPGGRPICTFNGAYMLEHNSLTPAMTKELSDGCVLPDVADPTSDYVQTPFSLDQESEKTGWCIAALYCKLLF
jgi:hypothetical protein